MAYIRTLRHGEKIPDGPPRRYPNRDGYIRLRWTIAPNQQVEVLEHRVVDGVVVGHQAVHHRNHVTHDNRPENLEPLTNSEHARRHNLSFDVDAAAEMYRSGSTTIDIGAALGVDPSNVYRQLVRHGVQMRRGPTRLASTIAKRQASMVRRWSDPAAREEAAQRTAHSWAALSPEERKARGEAISRGRLAGIARRSS